MKLSKKKLKEYINMTLTISKTLYSVLVLVEKIRDIF